MSLPTITLEEALRLLSLPRVVGTDPADGVEILAQNGRYGAYLTKDKDSRSLASEEEIFTVTLEQALALFAQPKPRRGRGEAKPPLREVGNDPTTGLPLVIKDGRFGPYVTDGDDQRVAAHRRRPGDDLGRAGQRPAVRAPVEGGPRGPRAEEDDEARRQEGRGEEDGRQEDRREEVDGQEDGRCRIALTMPGYFIAFEGGEGAGKSTQEGRLAASLADHGHSVVRTREPGGTPGRRSGSGTSAQPRVRGPRPARRGPAVRGSPGRARRAGRSVRPSLRGDVVICDRYIDSSVAYQGYGRDLGPERVRDLSLWATGDLLPDLTVVLDVDPEVGLARFAQRDRLEAEPLEYHRAVRAGVPGARRAGPRPVPRARRTTVTSTRSPRPSSRGCETRLEVA